MIGAHIEIILIITGAITAVALLAFIAPVPVLGMIFGEAPKDELGLALGRHWGLLIFLFGVLLIYSAFDTGVREPAMITAAIEKFAFVAGILGTPIRRHPLAATLAVGDLLIALIYVLFLAGH
jgi:hypothetical protein